MIGKTTPSNTGIAMSLVVILSAACFAGAVSIRMIDPIIPDIARAMASDPATVALLVSAFSFPYALSQPLLGPLGDAFGKARVIKLGLALLCVCLVMTAIAPNLEIMFYARAVAGLAGGAIIPVALAMIGDRIAYDQRQVALSQLLSAMLVAQFVSLIGSGLIASWLGWRFAIGLGAVIAMAALAVSMVTLKPRNVPRAGISLASVRASYATVFANAKAAVCYTAVFIEGIVVFGLLPYIAAMLEARGAGGIAEAGLVISGMGVGGLIYTFGVKRLLDRLGGMMNLIRLGGVVAAAGYCGVALAGPWPVELAAFVLVGFGFYAVHNSLQTQATELAPDHRGAAVALHAFFFFLGHAAGPPIYGALFAVAGETATILSLAGLVSIAGFVLASALQARSRPATLR